MSPSTTYDIKCQSQIEWWWWWFLSRILQFRIFFFNLTFPPPPFVKNKQTNEKNILKYALYRFESKLLLLLSFCHYPTGTEKKLWHFCFWLTWMQLKKKQKCWSSLLWLTIMIRQNFFFYSVKYFMYQSNTSHPILNDRIVIIIIIIIIKNSPRNQNNDDHHQAYRYFATTTKCQCRWVGWLDEW